MTLKLAAAVTALDRLPIGGKARITEIRGDRILTRRLLSLGLRVGSEIEVMQRRSKGVVVACAGNRVALGGTVADKLFALPLADIKGTVGLAQAY